MNYLIVANGNIKDDGLLKHLVNGADVVVCADGGANHLHRIGIFPDLVVGDLDSTEERVRESYIKNRVPILQYPQKKDSSDTELAVVWSIGQGASNIILTGVTGTRMDHTMANVFLLKTIVKKGVAGTIVDDNNEIYLLSHDCFSREHCLSAKDSCKGGGREDRGDSKKRIISSQSNYGCGHLSIAGEPGDLLSIVPITDTVSGLTLEGLEYPLTDAVLELGSSRGISNVFTEKTARIFLKEGAVIVTKSRD